MSSPFLPSVSLSSPAPCEENMFVEAGASTPSSSLSSSDVPLSSSSSPSPPPPLSRTAQKKISRSLARKRFKASSSSSSSSPPSSSPSSSSSPPLSSHLPGLNCVYILDPSLSLRHVVPYSFVHRVNAKTRWFGQALLPLLCREYPAYSPAYYRHAIDEGIILINGKKEAGDYILKQRDVLSHSVHRHEPPVSSSSPLILYENQQILAVSKPSSLPVHACGTHFHNSLLALFLHEGRAPLHPIHRLDRLTSGLVLLAKEKAAARWLGEKMKEKAMRKTYVARVKGAFPSSYKQYEERAGRGQMEKKEGISCFLLEGEEYILVDAPIICTSKQSSSHTVSFSDPLAKPAQTLFRLLSPSSLSSSSSSFSSVVQCLPLTGRTHQIRIHLSYLSFPILNDAVYGGRSFLSNTYAVTRHPGPGEGRGDCWMCEKGDPFYGGERHAKEMWLHAWKYEYRGKKDENSAQKERKEEEMAEKREAEREEERGEKQKGSEEMKLSEGFCFEAPLPDWALPSFDAEEACRVEVELVKKTKPWNTEEEEGGGEGEEGE